MVLKFLNDRLRRSTVKAEGVYASTAFADRLCTSDGLSAATFIGVLGTCTSVLSRDMGESSSMDADSDSQSAIEFGRFRVSPRRRELSVAGKPIELGGRAFDVLLALIEARGSV